MEAFLESSGGINVTDRNKVSETNVDSKDLVFNMIEDYLVKCNFVSIFRKVF